MPATDCQGSLAAAKRALPATADNIGAATVRRAPKRSSEAPIGSWTAAKAAKKAAETMPSQAASRWTSRASSGAITARNER